MSNALWLLQYAIMGMVAAALFMTGYYALKSGATLLLAKVAVRRGDDEAWAHWMSKYLVSRTSLHTLSCPLQWIHADHTHTWWRGELANGNKVFISTDFNREEK